MANHLQTYIDIVYEPDDVVEIRYIWPKGVPGGSTPHSIWHYAKDLLLQAEKMTAMNQKGWGVYCGVNPRRDFGLRGDKSVPLARNLFCDFDDIEPGDGCGRAEFLWWKLDEKNLPDPDLIINSGNGLHCYWRLSSPLTDLEKWGQVQQKLINTLGSDRSIKNPERVMRMPGFFNTKARLFKECFIIHGRLHDRFSRN